MYEYHVDAFVPTGGGCRSGEKGWDPKRCSEFAEFLNAYAQKGYRLHSSEYRTVSVQGGCGSQSGAWLVCIFEKTV